MNPNIDDTAMFYFNVSIIPEIFCCLGQHFSAVRSDRKSWHTKFSMANNTDKA